MPEDPARTVMGVRPETFLQHWRQIRDAKDEQADVSTGVARAKKAAKRDNVNLDAVKTLEMLAKMDADERDTFMRHLYSYWKWIDLPLGAFAMGIDAPAPKEKASEDFHRWQAGQDGFAAGKTGAPKDANPHPVGSLSAQAWASKWKLGFTAHNKKIAGRMAKGVPANSATGNGVHQSAAA